MLRHRFARCISVATITVASVILSTPLEAAPLAPSIATWAEPVGQLPNYIFPMMTQDRYTVGNVNAFQYLMYRPLYWYGFAATPNINADLSLAPLPTYSADHKTLTITLKSWRWSNGGEVSGASVALWLNLLHAAKGWWAAYTPGSLPDLIASVRSPKANQIVLTLTRAVNPSWFNQTQLSQITPLPLAWDISASGAASASGGCSKASYGTADAACTGVFTYLSRQAGFDPEVPTAANTKISSYATNPLWGIVDGPWRLTALSPEGEATFAPNPSYSGPFKPRLQRFREIPSVSDAAELAALRQGSIDVGFVPLPSVQRAQSSPRSTTQVTTGLNSFRFAPRYPWADSYTTWNLGSTGDFGIPAMLFRQTYVRQALQLLIDQETYAQRIYKGFAYPNASPIPTTSSSFAARQARQENRFAYDPTRALALLRGHGWTIVPGGTSTCTQPGTGSQNCGAGIPKGARFTFNLQYANDVPLLGQLMNAQQASWAQAGIQVSLRSAPSMVIRANTAPCATGVSCEWEAAASEGFTYQPSIYPLASQWLETSAPFNLGSYANPTLDAALASALRPSGSPVPSASIATQSAPVLFEPTPASRLTEVQGSLGGVFPENPFGSLTPERWYRSR